MDAPERTPRAVASARTGPDGGVSAHPGARPTDAAPKRRPNAWPSRVVIGVGAVAAMSVVTAGLVRFPTSTAADTAELDGPAPTTIEQRVVHHVKYVQLRRGQKAPAGAKVIRAADPTPRVVVRTVPTQPRVTRQRTVARSRQSGR